MIGIFHSKEKYNGFVHSTSHVLYIKWWKTNKTNQTNKDLRNVNAYRIPPPPPSPPSPKTKIVWQLWYSGWKERLNVAIRFVLKNVRCRHQHLSVKNVSRALRHYQKPLLDLLLLCLVDGCHRAGGLHPQSISFRCSSLSTQPTEPRAWETWKKKFILFDNRLWFLSKMFVHQSKSQSLPPRLRPRLSPLLAPWNANEIFVRANGEYIAQNRTI